MEKNNVSQCAVLFRYCAHMTLCKKDKKLLTFVEHGIIIGLYKHEQRLPHRKGSYVRCLSLTREWGKALLKPRINQYRVR